MADIININDKRKSIENNKTFEEMLEDSEGNESSPNDILISKLETILEMAKKGDITAAMVMFFSEEDDLPGLMYCYGNKSGIVFTGALDLAKDFVKRQYKTSPSEDK